MGVLAIFPIAAALAIWLQRRFEIMVFPAVGLITITMAIAGMAGVLKIGVYLPLVYAVVSVVYLIRQKKQISRYVLTPGFAAFCIYLVFFLVYAKGWLFLSEAAITQYAPSVLSLFEYDSMQDHYLYYHLNDPFPLGTLWAYYCNRLVGGYADWKCIFAFDVFVIAGVMPLFCQIRSIKAEKDNLSGGRSPRRLRNGAGSPEQSKGEGWQWLVMLAIDLFLPILKIFDAYRSFDMAIPQATAMVYTIFLLSRMIRRGAPGAKPAGGKGDILFAAYGLFAAITLTRYGVFLVIPLLASCCAVAISSRRCRKSMLLTLAGGCIPAFLLNLYNYAQHEIELKRLLLLPGCLLGCLVLGVVVALVAGLYVKGKKKTAVVIAIAAFAVVLGAVALLLRNSSYQEYVINEVVEFTDKLFEGKGEEDYVLGKKVIRIYDTTFMLLLMILSGIAHGRVMKRSKKDNLSDDKYLKRPGQSSGAEDETLSYTFHGAFICGVLMYLVTLCVLYIFVLRPPKVTPIPVIAHFVAPVIIVSAAGLFLQSFRAWKKDLVLAASGLILLACVYTDPVGEIFNKPEEEYMYPVIHECIENGEIKFTGEDRVFLMDPELLRKIPSEFCWEVYPAGAATISGLHFNADPYRWSAGEIQFTMKVEELEDLLREGGYTYVYLRNIVDFHIEKYHTLFVEPGPGMQNNAIYRVEYDEEGQLWLNIIAQD
ncbi:MAG: hypothetical protein IKM88_13060 [Lachnospiraceae bacterium]|nr:hypothetical protein [Lachnospiraceae bacterium]